MKDDLVNESGDLVNDLVNDCISRQAAIETVRKAKDKSEAHRMLIQLPSAQQWIPCSERLPENNGQVLVYARSVHYALAKYDEMREADGTYKKQWVTFDAWKPFYTIKDVLMWMPLPTPYREGGQDNA